MKNTKRINLEDEDLNFDIDNGFEEEINEDKQ